MINPNNIRTVTDMREGAQKLLKQVASSFEPLFIFYRSKPKAVLLDIGEYEKLKDMAEDYLDAQKAQEYEKIDKKKIDWISRDDV